VIVARYSLGPLIVLGISCVLSQRLYATVGVGAALWVAFLIAFGLERPRRLLAAAVLSGVTGVAWFGLAVPPIFSDGRCGVDGGTVYCPGLFDAYTLGLYGAVGVALVLLSALAALFVPTPGKGCVQ
jgi:hypothetical protein